MRELVILDSITKVFKHEVAVGGVNLALLKGRCHGLIGPNGSGKTTILNILATIVYPSSGVVHRQDSALEAGSFGFSSGHSGFFTHLNFKNNLALLYAMKGIPISHDEVARYSRIFAIDKAYDKPVSKYSTGMKQKLSIISAFIGNPDLIVLDEPTNGLDVDAVLALRELIKEVKQHASVVVTSHVLSELEEVCDDVFFLFQGKISERVSVDAVRSEYGSLEEAYKKMKYDYQVS